MTTTAPGVTTTEPGMTTTDGTTNGATTSAEMWFDPICPWAWLTSRWLTEVEQVRDVTVTWSVMSLAVLNEGRELTPSYRRSIDDAWGPVRVLIAARAAHGEEVLKPLYDAIGTRLHPQGRKDRMVVVAEALAEVDLPAELISAADTDAFDEQLRASHQRAIDLVGDDVGTPVISVNGEAFFGPVVTPAPRGEDAGRLWDGFRLLTTVPGLYEVKRSRTLGPIF
jgi:2-hydroxychromene-2-carboxylate isomerase